MTFFDETKSIIENINYLSGPLIFLVALYGLKQIKIAKDSLKINSMRESAVFTLELCKTFVNEMSPIYDDITIQMNKLEIDYSKLEQLNLHSIEKVDVNNANYEEYKKLCDNYEPLQYILWQACEKLETFSLPFIKKIADEELGYSHEFLKFYQYCNLCVIQIIKAREGNPQQKELYENVIELYTLWKSRNEKDKLKNQAVSILQKIDSIKIKKIKPLGT